MIVAADQVTEYVRGTRCIYYQPLVFPEDILRDRTRARIAEKFYLRTDGGEIRAFNPREEHRINILGASITLRHAYQWRKEKLSHSFSSPPLPPLPSRVDR